MYKKRNFGICAFIGVFAVFMLVGCGAPKALTMHGGNELDKMVRNQKVTIAVLPVIDWSEDEGCCKGYMLYGGWSGAFWRSRAYKDVDILVTNELIKALWKKNAVKLVKKDKLISTVREGKLTRNNIFPQHLYQGCFGMFPKPVEGAHKVGRGEPNYEKLYDLGKKLGADIIIIGRVTRNTSVGQLPNIVNFAPPYYLALLPVVPWTYKTITKVKYNYISIDIMALNIPWREVMAWGSYNKNEEVPDAKRLAAMEKYSSAITFYIPMPEREDLQKQFIANAGSKIATYIASSVLAQVGIPITIRFNFKYEFEDETWKMYPPDHFEKNYGITKSEYETMVVR